MRPSPLLDKPRFLAFFGGALFIVFGLPLWRDLTDAILGSLAFAALLWLALRRNNPFARVGRDEDGE